MIGMGADAFGSHQIRRMFVFLKSQAKRVPGVGPQRYYPTKTAGLHVLLPNYRPKPNNLTPRTI